MPIRTFIHHVRRFVARWARVCVLVACSGAALATVARTPEVSKEYQVKAAFLYNFAKFVDWPADRFSDETAPLRIAVIGRNPFGDELENAVRDRKINGRDIVVIYLASTEYLDSKAPYHVIYVASGEERSLQNLSRGLSGARPLTVGESDRFSAEGGIVRFCTVDDKVRFEINANAAETAGLRISAQLLKLATVVRRSSEGARR